MQQKHELLIVEDELVILEGLNDLFVYHGYSVTTCSDGVEGLGLAISGRFDCIILDVMLPGLDGFSICNEIRKVSRDQAVIMLTAKNAEEDIIQGLSLGADDYISKPFSVRELVLRVDAILRRTGKEQLPNELYLSEHLTVDVRRLSGSFHGRPVLFTRREIDILYFLFQQQGCPVSRKDLLQKIWCYKKVDSVDTRTVDIHIAKLRKKIELCPKDPQLLVTVRGEGYQLRVCDASVV